MEAWTFDSKKLITVVRFLANYKRECSTNKVLGDRTMLAIPTFNEVGLASKLVVRMTAYKDEEADTS